MSTKDRMREVQAVAERAAARKVDETRHKCFVSYRVSDIDEFIPRSVGVTEEDDFIDSDDEDYIKRRIRDLYLTDSTVTILLAGGCTWSRKFIDWELSSSLRNDSANRRNGALAISLPSAKGSKLQARVRDNWTYDEPDLSYALYRIYPSSATALREHIETAFKARTAKAHLVDNSRALRKANSQCP